MFAKRWSRHTANGEISRRQFLAQVEIDFSNIISAAELRRLLEEVA
jgi:hypothetical protein